MTETILKKSVKNNLDYARKFYETGNQAFATMFVIEGIKDKKKTSIAVALGNSEAVDMRSKIAFDLGIRTGVELFKGELDSIEAIFMMSEAWVSTAMKKGGKELMFPQPSLDPNRKEALISCGSMENGMAILEIFEVKKSLNLEKNEVKVTFESLKEPKKKKGGKETDAKAPLLDYFWDGVKMTENMFKAIPAPLGQLVKEMPVDHTFKMIVNQIEKLKAAKKL